MIPDSLVGLILFALTLGPGYAFVVVTERRKPRRERSALFEAAELVFVGAVASSLAALGIITIAAEWSRVSRWLVDPAVLRAQGAGYFLEEPQRCLVTLVVILALGYGLAAGAALLLSSRVPASIEAGSVWHEVLNPRKVLRASKATDKAFVTVEMADGRIVSGYAYAYSVEGADSDTDALALHAPVFLRSKGEPPEARKSIPAEIAVLPCQEISYFTVQYQDVSQYLGRDR